MNKRTFFSCLIVAACVMGLLAACTRPLPGPTTEEASATPTRPFMTLPTATEVPPTEPLPTEAPPTPVQATPTPLPATTAPPATPMPTLAQPTAVQVQVLQPVADDLPNKYRLRKGEFPFCIARRFDIDPYELLWYNGLPVEDIFYEGQVLWIPDDPEPFPWDRELREHPDDYTVRRGDTIYSVACRYGDVDPLAIAAANGLDEPYRLKVGKVIQIP